MTNSATTTGGAPPVLTVTNLRKVFVAPAKDKQTNVTALEDVSFDVAPGEIFTLLGPSGCGKTTTLRCVAGLESPDSGVIEIGGDTVYDDTSGRSTPASRRNLGMVFQSYAIWPHLTVSDNVAFPLKVGSRSTRGTRPGRDERATRVAQALDAVGLSGYESRRATDLSGGQQQRLALARAMVMRPRMLLLDEPLSNLDAQLRERMRFELKEIQRSLGLAALYVTHDQAEALSLSDRIAIMKDGRIVQVGRPEDVYRRPGSRFVAEFLGNANIVRGEVVESLDRGRHRVLTELGTLDGVCPDAQWAPSIGDIVEISIRPEAIGVLEVDRAPGDAAVVNGVPRATAYMGDTVEQVIGVGSTEVRVRWPAHQVARPGDEIRLTFGANDCLILRPDPPAPV